MPDFSLVPVDHQPDFGDASLIPVDHDPFSADGLIEQARTQLESQHQRLETGADLSDVGAPAVGDGGQFSAGTAIGNKTADIAGRVAYGMMTQLLTLPQRALEASAADVGHLGEDGYAPQSIGPAVDTAMTMMGGAGTVPAAANELRVGLKLPMDTASRMARATQMGFRTDMPLYHGSGTEFSSPRAVSTNAAGMESPGVSLALDPEVANEFAAARGSEQTNPQVYKLLHRAERPTSLTLDGSETHGQVVDALRSAFDAGHDAVMIKNYTSPGGIRKQNIIIVRDANSLRLASAGDSYPTADAAAIAALQDINPTSQRYGLEYAGRVYHRWLGLGDYSYTPPSEGTAYSSSPGNSVLTPLLHSLGVNAGAYHTHTRGADPALNENYSLKDKRDSDSEGAPSYLGAPSGIIYKYSPIPNQLSQGDVSVLGNTNGASSNSPARPLNSQGSFGPR